VGTADAATKTATDRFHGVRFRLSGDRLTVSVVPQRDRQSPDVRRELWGKRVEAVCATTFGYRRLRRSSVRETRRWPPGRMTLTYRFGRDVSRLAKWCLLEVNAGDIAAVNFEHFIRVIGTSKDDRRRGFDLRRYLDRNAGRTRWYRSVTAIVVDRQVIGIATTLTKNRRGRRLAALLCNLIQGSDVADFTPGHTIFGRNDVRLKVCAARPK
jgi:hypothetical protein